MYNCVCISVSVFIPLLLPALLFSLLSRYHRRAAEQGCVPCLLELGDAHYNGIGTEISGERAAGIYQAAVKQKSAQAMFNLGVMYEYGLGIEQDMHMSKRYYDMALSTDPVSISCRGKMINRASAP